jgi:hypothetical protein
MEEATEGLKRDAEGDLMPADQQVTAELLQTPQGPRIILRGIEEINLPREDILLIQKQVKNQLLQAHAEARQQGKMPPMKIVLKLPPSVQAKLQAPPPPPCAAVSPIEPFAAKPEPQSPVASAQEDAPTVSNTRDDSGEQFLTE